MQTTTPDGTAPEPVKVEIRRKDGADGTPQLEVYCPMVQRSLSLDACAACGNCDEPSCKSDRVPAAKAPWITLHSIIRFS